MCRDCSFYILAKNETAFIPCPKSLTEAKVKSFRLILVTKEISKQPSIDPVVWFLVVTLMRINNENQQAKQGRYKMYNLRDTKRWNGTESCV